MSIGNIASHESLFILLGPDGCPFRNELIRNPDGQNKDSASAIPLGADGLPFNDRLTTNSNGRPRPVQSSQISRDSVAVRKQDPPDKSIVRNLSRGTGVTEHGFVYWINTDIKKFIYAYALPYITGTQIKESESLTKLLGSLKLQKSKDIEGLLDRTQSVYEFVSANADDSKAKLLFLETILLFIKSIRREDSVAPPYSEKFHDFLLKEFLSEEDKNCKAFLEQLLILYVVNTDESQAKQLLDQLDQELKLSRDLAQKLFIKYPKFKKSYVQADLCAELKTLSTENIISRKMDLTNYAMNQIQTLSKNGRRGKLGFEIEMSGSDEFRSQSNQEKLISNYQGFADLTQDCAVGQHQIIAPDGCRQWIEERTLVDHSELRSLPGGFSLNQFNLPILYSLITDITVNKDHSRYATNHIHVDSRKFYPDDSIINFRRGNFTGNGTPYTKGWETIQVPLAIPSGIAVKDKTRSPFFSVSSYYDQMQLINGVYDIRVSPADLKEFAKLIDETDKEHLALMPLDSSSSKINQNFLAKFYIFYCKKYHREDLIPAILRLWHERKLPNISDKAYKDVFKLTQTKVADLSFLDDYLSLPSDDLADYFKLFEDQFDYDLLLKIKSELKKQGEDDNQYFDFLCQELNFPDKVTRLCELMNQEERSPSTEIFSKCSQRIELNDVLKSPYLENFIHLCHSNLINGDLQELSKDQISTIIENSRGFDAKFLDKLAKPFSKEYSYQKIENLKKDLVSLPAIAVNMPRIQQIKDRIKSYLYLTQDLSLCDIESNDDLMKLLPAIKGKIPLDDSTFERLKRIIAEKSPLTRLLYIASRLSSESDLSRLRDLFPMIKEHAEDPALISTSLLAMTNTLRQEDLEEFRIGPSLLTNLIYAVDTIDLSQTLMQNLFLSSTSQLDYSSLMDFCIILSSRKNFENKRVNFKLPENQSPDEVDKRFKILEFALISTRRIKAIDYKQDSIENVFQDLLYLYLTVKSLCGGSLNQKVEDSYLSALDALAIEDQNQLRHVYMVINRLKLLLGKGPAAKMERLLVSKFQAPEKRMLEILLYVLNMNAHGMGASHEKTEVFYFIEADKYKPDEDIKVTDPRFCAFLQELSWSGLTVKEPLLKYLQEFSLEEFQLLLFYCNSGIISGENLVQVMKKLKPIELNDKVRKILTDVSISPVLRSAVLAKVNKTELKEFIQKNGPIQARPRGVFSAAESVASTAL